LARAGETRSTIALVSGVDPVRVRYGIAVGRQSDQSVQHLVTEIFLGDPDNVEGTKVGGILVREGARLWTSARGGGLRRIVDAKRGRAAKKAWALAI
jgi:hypothetical protein